jgi:hypothetical protein
MIYNMVSIVRTTETTIIKQGFYASLSENKLTNVFLTSGFFGNENQRLNWRVPSAMRRH